MARDPLPGVFASSAAAVAYVGVLSCVSAAIVYTLYRVGEVVLWMFWGLA